jgi:outer membrane immunogenic protein
MTPNKRGYWLDSNRDEIACAQALRDSATRFHCFDFHAWLTTTLHEWKHRRSPCPREKRELALPAAKEPHGCLSPCKANEKHWNLKPSLRAETVAFAQHEARIDGSLAISRCFLALPLVMLRPWFNPLTLGAPMKKLLLASVAGAALIAAGSANAADLRAPAYKGPPPVAAPVPVFSWTGCYIGAHVGWGWGRKDFQNGRTTGGSTTPSLVGNIDTSGGIFGGQLGCDYQFWGAWVIGIQGSASGADINGFGDSITSAEPLHAKTDFLASVTGRLGWAGWNQVLIYVIGGGAWAHDRYWAFEDLTTATQSRSGWTIGAGVEWAFAPNWSAFVEWDHYDFGTKTATFSDFFGSSDVKQRIEAVKIGVNWRFNLFGKSPGVVARY